MSEANKYWNYRVIEFSEGDETWRAIHEVHYADDAPVAYSETPASVSWGSDEPDSTAIDILERMRGALGKPVLLASEFSDGKVGGLDE